MDNSVYYVGWGTLSLINAGLAQSKGRSGLAWWLISLLIGPLAIGPNHPVAHFGIQVKSTESVGLIADRCREAGLELIVEENVTCCYAVQNKVWATDPDGNKWEVYVVLDDDGSQHQSTQNACCADNPDCCSDKEACCTALPMLDGTKVANANPSACVCSM